MQNVLDALFDCTESVDRCLFIFHTSYIFCMDSASRLPLRDQLFAALFVDIVLVGLVGDHQDVASREDG